mmetsp:Transcript_12341/g.16817  ORF Transcript_12341/g.16817 Transcript_12341/m.16817 type:complete len:307 (+) Transcript_12341:272-1192(+)|eukprot:CAMPEP_0196585110 /NCGR_PEP_ID=MMETSP1081-20130531/49536_1 /TAXON_ID=36882 /ORGANISM="Pyramimonas amylifera, Strain CCMP720" /LENGTH=306 /DNA_ID=CAMNT_0041906545 /DNA_START=264 /DNA_END=1184 /DNA_ORIENTATION=+
MTQQHKVEQRVAVTPVKRPQVTLCGKLSDGLYQRCKKAAQFVQESDANFSVQLLSLLPTDYDIIVKSVTNMLAGHSAFVDHKANVLAFEGFPNDPQVFIGAGRAFLSYLHDNYKYSDRKTNNAMYERLAKMHLRSVITTSGHTFIYMNINIGTENVGKILIECYDNVCPVTVKNFVTFVKGESEKGAMADCPFHRIVPKGWLQCGDVVSGRGDKGTSIYGNSFADETFNVKHDKMGIVGMVNNGPHTNASQFYITLAPLTWMDGKYVGFGYIVDGMRVLRILEKIELENERPVVPVVIKECGVYTI